jgi:hypothetical protein
MDAPTEEGEEVMNALHLKLIPVVFDDENHVYSLDRGTGPEWLLGVTTVLKCASQGWMGWYAAGEMAKALGVDKAEDEKTGWRKPRYVGGAWAPDKAYAQADILKIVVEARKAFDRTSKAAQGKGKDAHGWIEDHIAGRSPVLPTDAESLKAVNAFRAWEETAKVEWLASELIVVSETHGYAGTLDAVARVNGKVALLDLKTSSGVYEEFFKQLQAYADAFAEMSTLATPAIDETAVVWIPKDGRPAVYSRNPIPPDVSRKAFHGLMAEYRFRRCVESVKENGGWAGMRA